MKFRVERDVFAETVAWAARTLPARPPVPVLTSGYRAPGAVKALLIRGSGRARIRRCSAYSSGRLDLGSFKAALKELAGAPAIVLANAG